MKLEFSQQIFEKSSNNKFHQYPSSESRVVPCGWTDRYDEANSRFSQFCERAEEGVLTNRFETTSGKILLAKFIKFRKHK
jgi:hypothetical protein